MPQNPLLVRATRRIERRMFLKALAVGLSLPAAAKLARIATAGTTAPPKRFMVLFMPHGIACEHYNPQVSPSDSTNFALDQTNVSVLGPLEPYKSYVNVYQGLQYVGAAATHSGIVNCLSGLTTIDTTTPRMTLEHAIAGALGVTPLILGACSHQPFGLDNNGMLFWDGQAPVDPQKNPAGVADSLFGSTAPAPDAGAPAVNPDVQLRSDLLALTASEIQGLQSELTGLTSEQTKLATHLAAIQSLQSPSTGGGSVKAASCTGRPSLPTVDMVRAASAGLTGMTGSNDYFYQASNFALIFQAQLELAAQALICNAAQVIGLMPMYATCDFDFTFAGAPGSHHSTLSHTQPQPNTTAPYGQYNSPVSIANLNPTTRVPFATAQKWFCQQLATYVVSVLAATDDPFAPGSKVLDNTLIYWMSEIGDGQFHTRSSDIEYPQWPQSLPLVSIGRAGGAIKSGQVVQLPLPPAGMGSNDRPATDLYLTFAQAMGAPGLTFPGTTGVLPGVLA